MSEENRDSKKDINEEAKPKKSEKPKKGEKKKVSGKKIALIVGVSFLSLIIALLITGYALFQAFYNKMTIETANTATQDLRELGAILRENLDADVSGYPASEVDTARRAIVLERIEFLPKTLDYNPIIDALTADRNADLSAYAEELTEVHMSTLRWAVYYEFGGVVRDIEPDESGEGGEDDFPMPPDTDKGTEDETTTSAPVGTTTPGDTGTISPEETTKAPEDTTTSEPEVTTTPEDTTTKKPEETTTKAPEVTTTKPPVPTTPEETTTRDPSISTVVTDTEPPAVTGGTVTDEDIYNVLIIGVDTEGSGFGGRSDTIIIASVNRVSKRIVLTSIMRDTIVRDPELGGYAKINSFYARKSGSVGDKAGSLMVAIKHNFGIEIDNYVVLNLKVFTEVMNIFGGVDVPLYYSEYINLKNAFAKDPENNMDAYDSLFTNKKTGYINVRLNADQANRYARIRKNLYNPASGKYQRSDDSYRTERQRNVIKGLIQQVRKMSLDQVIEIANKILPQVATDLSANDFLVKIMQYTDFAKYSVDSMNLTYTKLAWYPCKTDGYKVIFSGDPGYKELNGYTGVGILEAPYRDGYALMREAWRTRVYQ